MAVPIGATWAQVQATDHQGGYSGTAWFPANSTRHVVSWKNGGITDYGTIPNTTASQVQDSNRAGTLVGTRHNGSLGAQRSFRTNGGAIETLPAPLEAVYSKAYAISDTGDVVGGLTDRRSGKLADVAVRWPAGQPDQVVELAGAPVGALAVDLDENGTVLLRIPDANGNTWPYLWRDGVTTPLNRLPGATSMLGNAIANGRVVGTVTTSAGTQGVFWDKDGVPRTLPGSTAGRSINRDGLIEGEISSSPGTSGVWRLGTFEANLGTDARTETVGDDGSIGGYRYNGGQYQPTVWRCA
ncbi:putative membrane protein [Kibdelosporangium banguiense]|uniref:Membrane protein n=1 Tax=Kibdelosporangium banguiense TaxID=1365924 RepID=A0ABS4TRT9_9PSEU|nr:hypothetical protein [Kibdelosporangium banguiense]MBP2327119.1 putative membrane protein [Kibdelosporangium banguiense]